MSLIVPRYAIAPIDPKTGRFTREWYEYLSKVAIATSSSTLADDLTTQDSMDEAASDALSLRALREAAALNAALLLTIDQPKVPDDLMAWWPGNAT